MKKFSSKKYFEFIFWSEIEVYIKDCDIYLSLKIVHFKS